MTVSISFHVRMPSSPRAVRGMHPAIADMEASSYKLTWLRSSQMTSLPWCVHTLMAIRFPMQPVGTNSAASFPKISAARSSNRLTVGSSPYTSSPTSASAIARRISAVGRVTVSLRRSTTPSMPLTSSGSLRIPVFAIVALTFPVPLCSSMEQFYEHLIRNAKPRRRKPHHIAIPFNQTRQCQWFEPRRQLHAILSLNPRNVDSIQLPQSEEQLFVERPLRGHLFMLFDGQSPALQRA